MNDHFLKLKQNLELNPSFDQIIKARHAAGQERAENRSGIVKNTQLIGSLQRKTRVSPERTISSALISW